MTACVFAMWLEEGICCSFLCAQVTTCWQQDETDAVQVTNLMQVYKGLEDPDALTGVINLRQGGPSHADCILAAQKMGRWDEAAALFEVSSAPGVSEHGASTSALQHAQGVTSDALSAHGAGEGYLQSFLAAGKPRLLLSVAEGMLRREDQDLSAGESAQSQHAQQRAAAAGVAAAWRLSDWSAADSFLKARVASTHTIPGDVLLW